MYHHLTHEQRYHIFLQIKRGESLTQIAESIRVHKSTVSREIKRNKTPKGQYHPKSATRRAKLRKHLASRTCPVLTKKMKKILLALLAIGWSPEQISGRLRQHTIQISYETIYAWIREDKCQGGTLFSLLRHKGKKYTKRIYSKGAVWGIPDRVGIENRPAEVELKARLGDWEIDTIVGRRHKSCLLSIVDRKSKYTVLSHLGNKTKREVNIWTVACLKGLPVLSITADNGREFAGHVELAKEVNAPVYFANPYSSWERGLNEHTNGLVRQWLPKKTDFKEVSKKDLALIENRLNNRPRKVLNYKTPAEVMFNLNQPPPVALHT